MALLCYRPGAGRSPATRPLTLQFEMITLELGPTDHRLFTAVSPKPADAPIWKLLRTLKKQFHKRNTTSDK